MTLTAAPARMLLVELAERYIDARNEERPIGRELAPKTQSFYVECVKAYGRYLGHPPTLADLTAAEINRFLAERLAAGASPYTVKNRRTGLLVLSRYAADVGLIEGKGRIRRVYCPRRSIEGYDVETMGVLVSYLETLRGIVRGTGIPKRLWWSSLVRAKWDIGARASDMLRIGVAHFNPKGMLWLEQSKTGKTGWKRLNPSTVEVIAACIAAEPGRELIWPGYKARNLWYAFSLLATRAGVAGRLQFIRRGAGSEYEQRNPGAGWRFLRHSDPRVFDQSYRIDRICDRGAPTPPEIGADDTTLEICHRAVVTATPDVTPTVRRIEEAVAICRQWRSSAELTGEMVEAAAEQLDVTQTQIADAVGLTHEWVHSLVRGHKRIGRDSERRLRAFVGQLADGREPTPLGKDALAPMAPQDVPLSDEAREALAHDPMEAADLAVLAHWLKAYGVPGRSLADALGVKFKFYSNMRYGYKAIPPDRADRLRALFGVMAK